SRLLLPERTDRGLHRRTGRKAVVDQNRGASFNGGRRMSAPVQRIATLQLEALTHHDLLDQRRRNAQILDEIGTENLDASLRNGSHRQLRVAWHSQFAHEEEIYWHTQSRGHFDSHGNAAAQEAKHDDVRSARIGGEGFGELPSCVASISKSHMPFQ